jgi:septal ring factor EnvC (AmiA/AmiB activator)
MSKAFLLSILAALALAAGCVSYSPQTPLVVVGDQGYGGPQPETTASSGDTDQVRQLKDYAAKLQRQLADARRDLDQEKSRRKADEKRIDQLQDQVKDLQKQLAKANR